MSEDSMVQGNSEPSTGPETEANPERDAGQPAGSGSDGERIGSTKTGPGGENEELSALWMTVAGWFVMAAGGITIIAALILKGPWDLSMVVVVSMVFMGASYVLAGQALGDGRAWAIPLAMMSCLVSPVAWFIGIPVLLVAWGSVRVLGKSVVLQNLSRTLDTKARMAYCMWITGIFLMMVHYILDIRG